MVREVTGRVGVRAAVLRLRKSLMLAGVGVLAAGLSTGAMAQSGDAGTAKTATSKAQTAKPDSAKSAPTNTKKPEGKAQPRTKLAGSAPAKASATHSAPARTAKPASAAAKSETHKSVSHKSVPHMRAAAAPAARSGVPKAADRRDGLTTASINPALSAKAATAMPRDEAQAGSFQSFVQALWPAAQARGVSRATFEAAFAGLTPDPKIAELTHKQSEFVKPIWDYVNGAVTAARIGRGQDVAREYASTLDAVERRYGVDRTVILGIWGMETNFGSFTGGKDVIRSLATLAHLNYRGEFFRGELITALVILQQGHVDRDDMKGSWAGAMGQTQFMPSSFMSYAVDADGDGHKNIWTSVPDAMASTANYLRQKGWTAGLPWGVEVQLPQGFDWRTRQASFSSWASLGFRRADGEAMPRAGEARLFLPAGASGPAFLVTSNFDVIKSYNSSDAYAMGVGHLGDRIYGGEPIQTAWPVNQRQLDKEQRVDLQRQLARLGYDIGEPDGKLGSRTREAVRDFQERRGLIPDGHPTLALLETLRGGR